MEQWESVLRIQRNFQAELTVTDRTRCFCIPLRSAEKMYGCCPLLWRKVPDRRFQRAVSWRLKRRSDLNFHWRLWASEKPISGREPCLLSPCESSECWLGWHTAHCISRLWLAMVTRDPITQEESRAAFHWHGSSLTQRTANCRKGTAVYHVKLNPVTFKHLLNGKQLRAQSDRATNGRLCVAQVDDWIKSVWLFGCV